MNDRSMKDNALEELTTLIEVCAPLKQVSIAYVKYVLARFGGNKLHTARQIAIDRRTIQRWLPRNGGRGAP